VTAVYRVLRFPAVDDFGVPNGTPVPCRFPQ
jgi:hypothetical protein